MYSQIPKSELKIFSNLRKIKVVFDVGARDDADYLRIKPNIELHAFEPNPEFFSELKKQIGDKKKVFLNNYGLGDTEGEVSYNRNLQAFVGGEAEVTETELKFPIKTLDWYVKQNKIKQIDFLKIDTEGYDYKVLQGAYYTLRNIPIRYIQYEHWNNKQEFHDLLEKNYFMRYIGQRNVLCIRKGEEWL